MEVLRWLRLDVTAFRGRQSTAHRRWADGDDVDDEARLDGKSILIASPEDLCRFLGLRALVLAPMPFHPAIPPRTHILVLVNFCFFCCTR